jgi:SSS family solute:Na+ symporter
MIPGFFLSLLAVYVVSLLTSKPSEKVQNTFTEMEEVLGEETR